MNVCFFYIFYLVVLYILCCVYLMCHLIRSFDFSMVSAFAMFHHDLFA